MPLYKVPKTSSAAKTGAAESSLTITASATKPLRIHAVDVAGMGTASAANEIVMQRSTGTPAGGTSITPVKVSAGSAAASFTAMQDATSGVALTADTKQHTFGVNANGGYVPLTPIPGFYIPVGVGTSISFRSLSGTSNIVINVSVEEIDGD